MGESTIQLSLKPPYAPPIFFNVNKTTTLTRAKNKVWFFFSSHCTGISQGKVYYFVIVSLIGLNLGFTKSYNPSGNGDLRRGRHTSSLEMSGWATSPATRRGNTGERPGSWQGQPSGRLKRLVLNSSTSFLQTSLVYEKMLWQPKRTRQSWGWQAKVHEPNLAHHLYL